MCASLERYVHMNSQKLRDTDALVISKLKLCQEYKVIKALHVHACNIETIKSIPIDAQKILRKSKACMRNHFSEMKKEVHSWLLGISNIKKSIE